MVLFLIKEYIGLGTNRWKQEWPSLPLLCDSLGICVSDLSNSCWITYKLQLPPATLGSLCQETNRQGVTILAQVIDPDPSLIKNLLSHLLWVLTVEIFQLLQFSAAEPHCPQSCLFLVQPTLSDLSVISTYQLWKAPCGVNWCPKALL